MIGNYFIIKEIHLYTLENQGVVLFLIFILLLFAISFLCITFYPEKVPVFNLVN